MKNRMTKDEFKLWISEDTGYYGTYLDEEGNWDVAKFNTKSN